MKPRFEPDAVLIDPEAYASSEQQFSASLESERRGRFVVEEGDPSEWQKETAETTAASQVRSEIATQHIQSNPSEVCGGGERILKGDSADWRTEVAARVNSYRARRRPRTPRYPSLLLKFEPEERAPEPAAPVERELSIRETVPEVKLETACTPAPAPVEVTEPPETGKIIEFPRPWTPPMPSPDELAEPVCDRPRILEAPEVLPPPPALGGILIEPAEDAKAEKRPGFEIPLQSAPLSRRLQAAATDAVVVLAALALFSWLFLKLNPVLPALFQAAESSLLLSVVFWFAYQYLMLVYTGSTPGLKLASLQLCRFDGVPATRKVKRWRVLASALSGVSLGLGYAWCFLDEDNLCWHDRITRTYLAPLDKSRD